MSIKTKKKKVSKILETFKGKFVTIAIKDVRTRTSNLSFAGFLVDEDEEYFYLGESSDGPLQAAIPKSQNAGITLTDEIDFLMDKIDIPEGHGVQ